MDYALSPEQYSLIYNVSFLSLGSSVYAICNGHYTISLVPAGVFMTSINYWRKPDYSWRRYLDMVYVKAALAYQLYRAAGSHNRVPYYSLMVVAVGLYPVGLYYYRKKQYWYSTYAHCALHVVANVANIVLYSGRI